MSNTEAECGQSETTFIQISADERARERALREHFANFWNTATGEPRAIYDTFIAAGPVVQGQTFETVDSDGVHDNLNQHVLADIAAAPDDAQQAADAVTDAAWKASQHDPQQDPRAKPDDISVIVVDVPDA